jgi:hypothetical protein
MRTPENPFENIYTIIRLNTHETENGCICAGTCSGGDWEIENIKIISPE